MKPNTLKTSLLMCISIIVAIALLEAFCLATLWLKVGTPQPFLIDRSAAKVRMLSMQQNWGSKLVVSYLDPHLGFAQNPDKHSLLEGSEGFVRYGPDRPTDAIAKIVALGGSTTDPLTAVFLDGSQSESEDPYNWPQALAAIFAARNQNVEVLNGGVAGYSTSQELLKFIRDVVAQKPDIVVSMSGVNDMGFVQSVRGHPMVHRYQRSLFESMGNPPAPVFLPNTAILVRTVLRGDDWTVEGVSLGTANTLTDVQSWEQNIRTMNAVAMEFDVTFVAVLQPILGYGKYEMSDAEARMLEEKGEQYAKTINRFYDDARAIASTHPFCLDLSDVFSESENVYLDPRHQNEAGVRIIAEAVYEHLMLIETSLGLRTESQPPGDQDRH